MTDWLDGFEQIPMPASPIVAPRNSAKVPDSAAVFGKELGKRNEQGAKSKVQGWHDGGNAVAQLADVLAVARPKHAAETDREIGEAADDLVVVVEEGPGDVAGSDDKENEGKTKSKISPPKPKPTAKTAAQKKSPKEMNADRQAWVRRKSKPQAEVEEELKHAGTPKKRVVSDGHWRKDRSSPKMDTPKPEEDKKLTPKPLTIRRSVASVGLKVPPSVQSFVEDEPVKSRQVRHTSRPRSRERDVEERVADYEDSGVKVYVKRRRRSKPLVEAAKSSTESSALTAHSSEDKLSSFTTSATPPLPKDTPRKTDKFQREKTPRLSVALENEAQKERRPSRQKTWTPAHDAEERFRIPSATKSAEREVKPAPESAKPLSTIPPKPTGNRIEGWLAGMADPFTESTESTSAPDTPLDAPRRRSERSSIEPRSLEPEVSGQHDEEGHRRSSGRRRKSAQRASLEPIETYSSYERQPSGRSWSARDKPREPSPSRTPTLRLNGARRSLHSADMDSGKRTESREAEQDALEGEDTSFVGPSLATFPAVNTRRNAPGRTFGARPFPSTGKRLSTIASVETFNTRPQYARSEASDHPTVIPEGSVMSRVSDGDAPQRKKSGHKRRLAKHDDLMSVLSISKDESHGIISARSVRASRREVGAATVADVMNEVSSDELRYQRELRTLVDGVIPVLLTCVLSKSDSAVAAGLFSRSAKDDPRVTQPIIDMGIALERLKTAHKRIPMHDPNALLHWAAGATKVYADYVRAWRLGFQDVVVNLAPADESARKISDAWDHGIPRNKNGDLLDGDGERVDVAYLLKRPLVRLKYLAKTFKNIDHLTPSADAQALAIKYQELVVEARKRSNEERARLEDEAAANIDPTRARDPRSLAPLTGVLVDPTRLLRARDYFDMNLQHSSGQELVCAIEILLRNDQPERGEGGDVLFCEVSNTGRWLLFPPIPKHFVSARNGSKQGEIVVMVRGICTGGQEWRELMSLTSSDEQSGIEWVQMLGLLPVPPLLSRKSSFNLLSPSPRQIAARAMGSAEEVLADNSRTPSSREVEVPIGERAKDSSRRWVDDTSSIAPSHDDWEPSRREQNRPDFDYAMRDLAGHGRGDSALGIPAPAFNDSTLPETTPILKRAKAKRYRSTSSSPLAHDASKQLHLDREKDSQRRSLPPDSFNRQPRSPGSLSSYDSQKKKEYTVWLPSSQAPSDESENDKDQPVRGSRQQRPQMHRRTSSVPSLEMPTVNKNRRSPQPSTPKHDPSSDHRRTESEPLTPPAQANSAPAKLQKRRASRSDEQRPATAATPASPSARQGSPQAPLKSSMFMSFTPAFLKKHRRSSSPLKHEYDPSTATDSDEESDLSSIADDVSITSDSSNDEGNDVLGDLRPLHGLGVPKPLKQVSPPESLFSIPGASLAPSQSASQAPYRTVPQGSGVPSKTVACVFSWSDGGAWESMHPEECSVVVTPGLIEAFDLTQAHCAPPPAAGEEDSSPSARGIKPLVALELTPLVPLRRGTAVDISIRSPPTANSLIRTGNNIMFRSRSPEECEALYALINRARINNPTYIALQNARGPFRESNWAAAMDRQNAARASSSSSWFGLGSRKSSTYRSNGSRPVSVAETASSVGTMNTAFSALRRFSGSNRLFNIARSTITSMDGSRSTTSESLSSGSSTPLVLDPKLGTPLGIANSKIRLYTRETTTKWRDMGPARMNILLPPRPDPSIPANPRTTGLHKRILILGKTKGETLLDVTLGESCFERVARTGIAVSVWEEATGPNGEIGQVGAKGGVSSARAKVYMIQLKSERDCTYTFGLVGKLRY